MPQYFPSKMVAVSTMLAVFVFCFFVPAAFADIRAKSSLEYFEGLWVDGSAKMLAGQEHGLLVIFGSDPDTTYRLHCIVAEKTKVADCLGHGLVNGKQGILIKSEIRAKDDGGLIEEWKALIPNTTKQGVTNWTRQSPAGRQ